jgi:hypothetical protein
MKVVFVTSIRNVIYDEKIALQRLDKKVINRDDVVFHLDNLKYHTSKGCGALYHKDTINKIEIVDIKNMLY